MDAATWGFVGALAGTIVGASPNRRNIFGEPHQQLEISMLRVFVAIAILFSIPIAHAGSTDGERFVSYDRAQDSCGQFVQARRFNQQEDLVYSIWLAGYITAYNKLTPDTTDLLNTQNPNSPTPMAGPMAWLERYCADHPMSALIEAVIKFTEMQYPSRKR